MPGIAAERASPSRVKSIGLNSTPRKSLTRLSRIKRGRSTGLAADDRGKRPALRLIGPLVDNAGKNPVAVGHDLAGANDQRKFKSVEAGLAATPVVDPEHQRRDAMVVGHRPLRVRVDARTEIVAVAALHILAAHRPFLLGH